MIVYTYKKEKVNLAEKPFSSGGEGEVRSVATCPSRFSNVCAKLYFKPTVEQEKKIRFMVENPPQNIVGKSMMLAWPLETIYKQDGTFVGFLMPMAFPDSKKLSILVVPKLKAALKDKWYKFDKEYDVKCALISRMKLINNIALPIYFLHSTDKYVLKDFKPDNVLVTSTGEVAIVDMDSIQICNKGKLIFPGTAATDNYIPPEFYKGVGQNKQDILQESWDNFAISVVFYQLLFGLHPYVVTPFVDSEESSTIPYCVKENLFPFGNNASKVKSYASPHDNFKIVPDAVQKLFVRAFGSNPDDRPQTEEWIKTIKKVIDDSGVYLPPPPKDVEHSVEIVTSSNGSATLSLTKAKSGTVIYIYSQPDKGYEVSRITCSSKNGETNIGKQLSFSMPDSNVVVRVEFEKKEKTPSGIVWKVVIGVIAWVAAIVLLLYMLTNG